MKFLYTTLALLIYVQSFALYGLRDYSCCGSHTRTEVKAKKVFTCCSHEKHRCDTNKTKDKPTDKHDACNGDMCKCVSCHLSLVYLPLFQGQPESQNVPVTSISNPFAVDRMHGNDFTRALLQPPRLI
ncbi:MAG: hypothetical protein U0V54_09260 [Saprospiraceae bacterium]|nr:hypothetical protein [Saprospiraceae bacterium]